MVRGSWRSSANSSLIRKFSIITQYQISFIGYLINPMALVKHDFLILPMSIGLIESIEIAFKSNLTLSGQSYFTCFFKIIVTLVLFDFRLYLQGWQTGRTISYCYGDPAAKVNCLGFYFFYSLMFIFPNLNQDLAVAVVALSCFVSYLIGQQPVLCSSQIFQETYCIET